MEEEKITLFEGLLNFVELPEKKKETDFLDEH